MLIGRDTEHRLLRGFVRDSRQHGASLLLGGDPGVGKTALLDLAAHLAETGGSQVVRAAGVEFEAKIGYSCLQQLLSPLDDERQRLPGPLHEALLVALGEEAGPPPRAHVVRYAALRLVVNAAGRRPVLLVVDDVHWVDASSSAVLAFLAGHLPGTRVGLLVAAREGYPHLLDRALPTRTVGPLLPHAAQQLLAERFPVLAPRVRERILVEASGNPLALLELPAPLSLEQREDDAPLPDRLPLTRRLEGLFTTRLAALPVATRHLLLLAVLGGTGDLAFLARCAAHSVVTEDLAPAVQARLVQLGPDGRELRFRHPIIRSSVVGLSTARERRDAHRDLAGASPPGHARRAWHLAEAATGPDEHVASILERDAMLARHQGDAVRAVASLHRAAALSPSGGDRARRLGAAAYLAADVTGAIAEVAEVVARARDAGPSGEPPLEAAAAAAYALLNSDGDVDTAYGLLASAIEAEDAQPAALVEALHTLMLICFFGGRPELWAGFRSFLARLGAEAPIALALGADFLGAPVERGHSALPALESAVAGLAGEADPTVVVRVGMAAFYAHRIGDCRAPLWQVVRDARSGGAVGSGINALLLLAFDELMTGAWDRAERLAVEALGLCESHGYRLLAWPAQYALGLLAASRGDRGRASALGDAMLRWGSDHGAATVSAYGHHVHARVATADRDFERAYRHASAVSEPGTLSVAHALWLLLDLTESAVHTGRHEQARAHVAALRAGDVGGLSSRYALLMGAAEALVDDAGRSSALLERALSADGASRWPFDRARVQLVHGEVLRRSHQPTRARVHLGAAQLAFSALGAQPWAARAGAELQAAAGSRVTGDGDRPRLTAQELQVAELAATGLTNKQIAQRLLLSPRTVSAHLYRVFPKLAVTSRAALRDALESWQAQPRSDAGAAG